MIDWSHPVEDRPQPKPSAWRSLNERMITMETTPVRLTNASDLVRASELLIGFTPVDSIVVIGLSGKKVVITARVDMDAPHCAVIAQSLARNSVTSVAIVVWNDLTGCAISNRAIANVIAITKDFELTGWLVTNGRHYRMFGESGVYPLNDMDPVSDALLRVRTEMPREALLRLLTITDVNEARRDFIREQVQPLLANKSFATGLASALLTGDDSPEDCAYMFDAMCDYSIAQRDRFLLGVAHLIAAKADINYTYERVSAYLTNPIALAGLAAAALMTGHGFEAGVLADRAPQSALSGLIIEHLEHGLAPQTLIDCVVSAMEDETE